MGERNTAQLSERDSFFLVAQILLALCKKLVMDFA